MSATAVSGAIPQARALAAGEQVGRLFDEHGRLVLGLCRSLLADATEAEDAAQQTFLSAYRSLLAGRPPRDEAAWIATIARNECRARIRKRMSAPTTTPLADDLPLAAVADTAETAERNAELEDLRAGLRELPERQRTALALREFYGLRYDEVATAMGVEQATVESLLWRARKRLEQRARVLPRLRTVLVVPASLREDLGRLVPGFSGGADAYVAAGAGAAGVGVPLAAKVATTLAAVAATSVLAVQDGVVPRVAEPQEAQAAASATGSRSSSAGPSVRGARTGGDSRAVLGPAAARPEIDERPRAADARDARPGRRSGKRERADRASSGSGSVSSSGSVESVPGSTSSDPGSTNSGSGSVNSGSGSVNSGSGSTNSGSGSTSSGSGSANSGSGSTNSGSGSTNSGSGSTSSGSGSVNSGSGSTSSGSGSTSSGSGTTNSGSGSTSSGSDSSTTSGSGSGSSGSGTSSADSGSTSSGSGSTGSGSTDSGSGSTSSGSGSSGSSGSGSGESSDGGD